MRLYVPKQKCKAKTKQRTTKQVRSTSMLLSALRDRHSSNTLHRCIQQFLHASSTKCRSKRDMNKLTTHPFNKQISPPQEFKMEIQLQVPSLTLTQKSNLSISSDFAPKGTPARHCRTFNASCRFTTHLLRLTKTHCGRQFFDFFTNPHKRVHKASPYRNTRKWIIRSADRRPFQKRCCRPLYHA